MAIDLQRNKGKLEARDENDQLIGYLPIDAIDIKHPKKIKDAFQAASENVKAFFVQPGERPGIQRKGWVIETSKPEGVSDIFVDASRGEEAFERAFLTVRSQYARRLL